MTPVHLALALAQFVPDIARWITGGNEKAATTAQKVVDIAQAVTGQSGVDTITALKADPGLVLQFQQKALELDAQLRVEEIRDRQAEHKETQETIRSGDNAEDPYVRHTRPLIARQSWYGMALYIAAFEGMKAAGTGTGASLELAILIASPVLAYIGFRSMFDKGGFAARLGSVLGRK